MKTIKTIIKVWGYIACIILFSNTGFAKDYEATLVSDPDGAIVYYNGMIVAQTTPAIIKIDKKQINKNLLFRFEKPGYESKTVIVSFDKKDLEKGAIIYAKLDIDKQAEEMKAKKAEMEAKQAELEAKQAELEAQRAKEAKIYEKDPGIPEGQATARVSRDNAGQTDMERSIIRWYFDSDPRGARIYYRVISNNPAEVKNTNETYLTTTPYEETKGFGIPGLTYENARNVTIEVKASKKGYADQVKRYNVRQALDQQEISGFFELVPNDWD